MLKKALNDDEESDTTQNSTKMSIRFHIDSDWKLEDSNDGDREDNDDISRFEKSDILNDVSQTSDIIGDKYGNSSSEITTKTLAPQDQTTMTRRILNLLKIQLIMNHRNNNWRYRIQKKMIAF